MDCEQGLIRSDHKAPFTALYWCREAENSFRRSLPRDEQDCSVPQSTRDVRDGNSDPTSLAPRHLLAQDEQSYLDTCVCLPSSKPVSAA